MSNYIISGRQASGKSTQAAALAGTNPLRLCNKFELSNLDTEHTAIIIDEINDIGLIKAIIEMYTNGIVQFNLPIILITSLPLNELVNFFGKEWSILITNYPNPTLQVSFYENK